LKSLLGRIAFGVAAAGALLYGGDYLALRLRIPGNREPFGAVDVQRSYTVPLKSGRTEYYFDPPVPQRCVNSLFPHFGSPPCWYLRRHTRQVVNTGGAPPAR